MERKGSYAANLGTEYYLSSHTNPAAAGVFEVVPIDEPVNYIWQALCSRAGPEGEFAEGVQR